MKGMRWQIILGLSLVVLSVIFYYLHYAIFRDAHHIFIYMIGDIAFVFIEVLLVTLIIHQLLSVREKRARLEKLNMVIGAFFSEIGAGLVTYFSDFDPKLERIKQELIVRPNWSEKEFSALSKRLKSYDYGVEIRKVELEYLRDFLIESRLEAEIVNFESKFGFIWTHFRYPRLPRTTNIIEGIIDQLKHKITDCHGFEYSDTAWNCLKMIIMNYRFHKFTCSRINGHNSKSPLELGGVKTQGINWIKFSQKNAH